MGSVHASRLMGHTVRDGAKEATVPHKTGNMGDLQGAHMCRYGRLFRGDIDREFGSRNCADEDDDVW